MSFIKKIILPIVFIIGLASSAAFCEEPTIIHKTDGYYDELDTQVSFYLPNFVDEYKVKLPAMISFIGKSDNTLVATVKIQVAMKLQKDKPNAVAVCMKSFDGDITVQDDLDITLYSDNETDEEDNPYQIVANYIVSDNSKLSILYSDTEENTSSSSLASDTYYYNLARKYYLNKSATEIKHEFSDYFDVSLGDYVISNAEEACSIEDSFSSSFQIYYKMLLQN